MITSHFTRRISAKNKYNRVNFVYRDAVNIGSSYMYFRGLKTALERNGLLHYAYDVTGTKPLDMGELLKYPVLCIRGSWEPIFDVVKLISGRQFTAEINSESLFPRKGAYPLYNHPQISKLFQKKSYSKFLKLFKQRKLPEILSLLKWNLFPRFRLHKDFYFVLRDRKEYFDLYFSGVEEDLNKYFGKPCYWIPSWAHTELLDDISPSLSDKLGFIGLIKGERRRFFNQDKNKIVECVKTIPKDNAVKNVEELCKLINKYRFLVSPMGTGVRGLPGKVFEYMACKRLCFSYLDNEYMFKSRLLFEDQKEIIYFKTFTELEEKYKYYLKNPQEAARIAQAGYEKVRKYHNADVRAKRMAELVLHHANGGEYDESFNDISLFGAQSPE